MNKSIKENLKKLCLATGVAGREMEASKVAAELLKKYTKDIIIDPFGNVRGVIKSKDKDAKTLLLDAHIDEIGMIVTSIDDKGFLHISNCGGMDRRLMSAQIVTVHGKKDVTGVIGSKPPHLQTAEEAKKNDKLEDLYIDIGCNKEDAEKLVSLGDNVTIRSEFIEQLNGKVSCKALDDRAGVASILRALELIDGREMKYNVVAQFSAREEIGGQGAAMSTYAAEPDFAIAVDVSFAHTPDAEEKYCGKMGEGVMIGYHVVLDKLMTDELVRIAKSAKIKNQIEAYGGRGTGTNADNIILSRGGVRTALLSIPQKYMHTPIEQVLIEDVENTAKLMAEYIVNSKIK